MSNQIDDNALHAEIERRAYQHFCDRGSVHGEDVTDWLAAEREVLAEQGDPPEASESTAEGSTRRRQPKGSR